MIVIGSSAANHHHPEIWPEYKDTDLVMSYGDFKSFVANLQSVPIDNGKKFACKLPSGEMAEIEIAWPGTSSEQLLEKIAFDNKLCIINGRAFIVPSMDWLFTIKASHRYKKNSVWFDKTIKDYFTMKELGCKIADEEWLKLREKETYIRARPKLNVAKESFFKDDSVKYIYDHDSIHEAMKHLEKPAYLYYKPDDQEVMCSKEKWDQCSEEVKLYGVLEESYVLALERSQIPFEGRVDPTLSFRIALMKVCTSITSGWFREFAYEHYFDVLNMYTENYLEKFKTGLKCGTIVRKEQNNV